MASLPLLEKIHSQQSTKTGLSSEIKALRFYTRILQQTHKDISNNRLPINILNTS